MRRLNRYLVIAAAVVAAVTLVHSSGPTVAASETETIDATVLEDGGDATATGGGPTPHEIFMAQVHCAFQAIGNPFGGGGRDCPEGEVAPPSAATVAEIARDEVPVVIPAPNTSPPANRAQLTGLRTWFWLDPGAWVPVTARAELGGVWAEVTATPVRATWNPGDGGRIVTCLGPARPHPGHDDATTDCGHVYDVMGDYSIGVAVTYDVTWSASTGESGTQDPIVLITTLPIHVEQRQAVTT